MGVLGIIILIGIIWFFVWNPASSVSEEADSFLDNINDVDDLFFDYNCVTDFYNCDDFGTQSEAQEVFDVCGPDDIHRLDSDNDGVVCEGLG